MATEAPVVDACVASYWHAYDGGNPLPNGLRVREMDEFCRVISLVPIGLTDSIKTEWEETIGQEVVKNLLADRYRQGLILDLIPTRLSDSTRNTLRIEYRFTDANRDMKYLQAAGDARSLYIISENSRDFFRRNVRRRDPSMNVYLHRAAGIEIATIDQANPELKALEQSRATPSPSL